MHISASAPSSVLLVCLGNICRSPTAEEILRQKAAVAGLPIQVDSAGTGDWHIGEHPDSRACRHAKQRGYKLNKLVARQVTPEDFQKFDLILAMDSNNLSNLESIKAEAQKNQPEPLAKLAMFSEEDPMHGGEDVPDPYQGDEDAFELVLDRIEAGADAWIESWKA